MQHGGNSHAAPLWCLLSTSDCLIPTPFGLIVKIYAQFRADGLSAHYGHARPDGQHAVDQPKGHDAEQQRRCGPDAGPEVRARGWHGDMVPDPERPAEHRARRVHRAAERRGYDLAGLPQRCRRPVVVGPGHGGAKHGAERGERGDEAGTWWVCRVGPQPTAGGFPRGRPGIAALVPDGTTRRVSDGGADRCARGSDGRRTGHVGRTR